MPKFVASLITALFISAAAVASPGAGELQFQSAYMRVVMAPDQPAFVSLTVDSLGKSKLDANPLRPPSKAETAYQLRHSGTTFEYRPAGASKSAPAAWTFQFAPRQIHLRSRFSAGSPPPPLALNFNPHLNHATLLGLINEDGSVRLPALLHLPDLGTFRVTSSAGLALGYDALRYAHRDQQANDYVRITFPAATANQRQVDYDLEVVAIYPQIPGIKGDPRFDGFRRDWLNIFQLNPRERVLANHAASDPVAFTIFEYSSMAVHTPPLAPGLTALDMVRQTLDRYLGGMKGYGMQGYGGGTRYDFCDTYPSLLMAASDYVTGSKDHAWLRRTIPGSRIGPPGCWPWTWTDTGCWNIPSAGTTTRGRTRSLSARPTGGTPSVLAIRTPTRTRLPIRPCWRRRRWPRGANHPDDAQCTRPERKSYAPSISRLSTTHRLGC